MTMTSTATGVDESYSWSLPFLPLLGMLLTFCFSYYLLEIDIHKLELDQYLKTIFMDLTFHDSSTVTGSHSREMGLPGT